MNQRFHTLNWIGLLLVGLVLTNSALSQEPQESQGIKKANLKGADLELINNHDPDSQLEHFDLLPGYQANLFASDPMFANPVHMQWDSKGRLWVACSWAYPQLKPGEVANDKIIILEDTDEDGVADKSTVFADGLYLPTGIELANGGCYVAQSPDVFFLKDTDGDDVADKKELVLTGFGIEDSHHSISAWRRGPGGWIYFQEGIFLHAQVETQYGVVRNFNGGVYQFNPRTQELRMFCRGTGGNPWGHVFDRWGQSFMVNNPRIMHLSPATGNSGDAVQVKPLISTEKQCGGDLATGAHVGDDIRGQLLTGRFKSRTVVRYEFIENGAGFNARVLKPLISSRHPNFRPVDVKIGPDGAVYVADWYNSIINHAQHDFRDPRRDHDHGRIWRITHKDRPLVKRPKLVGESIEALIDNLKSTEAWTRHQARKELSEREPDKVLSALQTWVQSLNADAPDYEHHLVEAMWACQNVERVSEGILSRVLSAKDGNARSAGARMIRYWHDKLSDPVSMIAKASGDPFPRTRMEAVLSAGFIPSAESFVAALNVLDHPSDPVLDQALPQTMKALKKYWGPAMDAGKLQFAKPSHSEFAEQNAGIGLGGRLEKFLKQRSPTDKEIANIQAQLMEVATDAEVRMIVSALSKGDGLKSHSATIAMLETLQRLAKPDAPKSLKRRFRGLKKLVGHKKDSIAVLAAKNLGSWGAAGRDELATLQSDSSSAALKQALAIALAKTSPRYEQSLKELAAKGDLETRYAAVAGLAQANLSQGVKAAASLLSENPNGANPVSVVENLLRHRKGGRLLSDELKGIEIHPEVKASVSKFHRDSGLLSDSLAEMFQPSSSASSLTAELLKENIDSLSADVEKLGDPARGELVYRRKSVACTSCHAVGSAGPAIGPNLVAVGAAAKTKYLVQSILAPNAAIAEHYETRMFLLASGKVQTGIVTFRSEDEVVVRDSAQLGKEVRIDADDIDDELAGKSLMPAGLADQLQNREEFLDLVRFLSALGKSGEYKNDERPVMRKWEVIAASAGDGLPSEDADWQSAYSKVSGELPPEDYPTGESVFARGFVNVLSSGMARLDINSVDGLTLRIDGKPIDDLAAPIKLEKGRRTLTFGLSPQRRKSGLCVELKASDNVFKCLPEGGVGATFNSNEVFGQEQVSENPVPAAVNFQNETLKRIGRKGDNWCITWAKDGSQITSMDDGNWTGFEETKFIHNNVYRITGEADSFEKSEIPAYPEFLGEEGSWFGYGIVAVDESIYSVISKTPGPSWSGPFTGIKILKSADNGNSWSRVNRRGEEQILEDQSPLRNVVNEQEMFFLKENGKPHKEKEAYPFSFVSFVQNGQNGSASKDGFVYIYSPEGAQSNRLTLARVPKDSLAMRDKWEYFTHFGEGQGDDQVPAWSSDIEKRGYVHQFPDRNKDDQVFGWYSWLPSVVWNEGLGLYIMVNGGTYGGHGMTNSDKDYYHPWMHTETGSLGFWYSENPYGPWKQFFYTDKWIVDNSANRTYQPKLSPKWISKDGKQMTLIWSDAMKNDKGKSHTVNYLWNQMQITIDLK